MVPPRKASYRSDLFSDTILTSVEAVEAAVDEFAHIVNHTNVERMLNEVMSQESHAVVRLVLAGLSKDLVMACFPITAEAFHVSLTQKMLTLLSVFFSVMEGIRIPDLHEKHFALVKEAPELLNRLRSQLLLTEPDPESPTIGKKGKAVSQKKIKATQRAQSKPILDPAPFERLDLAVPDTRDEIERCVEIVLATQRSILDAYLEALRLPAVTAALNAAVLPAESTYSPATEEPLDTEGAGATQQLDEPPVSEEKVAYTTLPPIKFSSLYRKRAKGFGEWDVNVSPRAESDLRKYTHADRKLFVAIVKKMRELSNGIFSPDNYKPINGENVEVPIYEAMVTAELRLVYQIDCTFIYDHEIEQQTIKVFGIYTEGQLTRASFWDSMSRELGQRGQEYKDRCGVRQKSFVGEDYILVPARFPVRAEMQFSSGRVPDLPTDDVEQIQSLLLKTVHLSEELLKNILEDRDVAVALQISPRELNIIEHPHSCYVMGRSGTGKSTTMIYKMLMVEASSELSPPTARKIRQVFVCKSPVLAGKVGEHFDKLFRGYRPVTLIGNVKAAKKADRALVSNEHAHWRSDLPKQFSDLQDADFPLFVSFEQLCLMIENDMSATSSVFTSKTTVTYERFRRDYWSHFSELLRRGFDSSMVFSEFMGVISGSEETLSCKSHFLDRDTYTQLSGRRQSTFASQREQIYDLFEAYLSRKRHNGDRDAAERTHAILEFFTKHGVPGRKIDYLYVDEVQDNLLIDTLLLRSLCQNPNGLFWAGDTAQTIAAGSSFKFDELKAFLYRTESNRHKKHPELDILPPISPRVFQLTVNYRSQTRIVNCARTIIETLTALWPESIDRLDPETGTVDGLQPIFFTDWDSDNVESKQFLFGNESSGSIELGAQQCILVRDDAAKEELKKFVGEIGIIMTLHDSKGLEFNDVLLYNFFADSVATEAQWRIVLNFVENCPHAPGLDSMRQTSICSELKFLYVAITRARNNIWIADCSTKGEPMRTLWTSKGQVQSCVLGVDTPQFAIASTPEEWQEQAWTLFESQQYSEARLSFIRAYMPHEAAVSEAYQLFKESSQMPCNSRQQTLARKAAFRQAAVSFTNCAKNTLGDTAKDYYNVAGECFEHAEDIGRAIAAYTSAGSFGRVAQLYLRSKKIDEAVATVKAHEEDIDPELVEKVIAVARIFFFNKGHIGKARELFPKEDDALVMVYLEERGMDCERAAILESSEEFSAAAEIHLKEGRTSEAIALFLRDQNIERAGDSVLHELWAKFPFGVLPNAQDCTVMLEMIGQLNVSALNPSKRAEISMFIAIANRDWPNLLLLAQSFLKATNKPPALLSLDHYFANNRLNITTPEIEEAVADLRLFLDYVFLLHNVTTADPCISINTRKLLGYKKEGEDRFLVPTGTFLQSALSTPSGASDVLSSSQLREIFQESLRQRMFHRIREENAMCRSAKEFAGPCPRFALSNGQCNHFDCRQEHILPSALDQTRYNLRLRMHLLQILIYQGLTTVETGDREFWLSRLYTILNPLSYQLGSAASLDLGLIPEAQPGIQIVKEWVRDGVYSLQFKPESQFLTRFVHLTQLGFQFDAGHAMSYLNHASISTDPRKPLVYRAPPDGRYVLTGYIYSLDDRQHWCLSAGIDFFCRVVSSKLTIQMNLLCGVAERLCTGLAVAACLERSGSLHGLMLPRSWLIRRSLTAGGVNSVRDTNAFWLCAQTLVSLLMPLCSGMGAEHLLYQDEHLASKAYFVVRDTFLSRIMRCLCFLADNLRNPHLHRFVWESITSLRSVPSRRLSSLCSRYVNARQWAGLAIAAMASMSGSCHDEMVQIVHTSRWRPKVVEGVRQIVYTDIADLPRLLGSSQWMALTPNSRQQLKSDISDQTGTAAHDASADEEEANDERQPEDVAVELPAMPEPEPRSEEEIVAARKIYKVILQASSRKKERKEETKSSVTSATLEFFTVCRGTSLTMNKAQRTYRLLFCGPFPHLLWCLASALTRAQAESQKILAKLSSPDNDVEELEKLDKERLVVERAAKQLAELRQVLNPSAEMHGRRIVGELKTGSQKADEALRSLPFEMPSIFFRHLDIAYKGILQPRAIVTVTRRAQPKPKLNTYDDEIY